MCLCRVHRDQYYKHYVKVSAKKREGGDYNEIMALSIPAEYHSFAAFVVL